MGSDRHYPEEAPIHRVAVEGFWIDRFAVTNADFARFVAETGYVTLAERAPNAADYPGARPEAMVPSSVVFQQPKHRVALDNVYSGGPMYPVPIGGIRADLPVASAASPIIPSSTSPMKTLRPMPPGPAKRCRPRRSGSMPRAAAWPRPNSPGATSSGPAASGWRIPGMASSRIRTCRRGAPAPSPVGSYPANGYGLCDMIGNCWEWTSDWYQEHGKAVEDCCGSGNTHGGVREASIDPRDTARIPRKVMKGGSYLCAPNYCRRYRPAARMAQPIDTATCHLGFRCVVRPAG